MKCLFILFFIYFNYVLPLYKIMDEVSFNLKDYRDSLTIYNNFTREGDTVIYKNNIILAPKVSNTFGLIYTNHEILSSQIEIHINFKISPEKGYGSAFAIWFFKDDLNFLKNSSRNISYLGFKQDFDGVGIFFITKPKFHTEHFTSIFIKKNDGSKNRSNFGMKKLNRHNSCHIPLKQMQYMNIIFTPGFYLKFKDEINIQNPCIFDLGGYHLEPPYRIGISTYNGIMMGEEYLDNITIEKFVLVNDDMWDTKDSFIKYNKDPHKKILDVDYILNYSSDDLIEKSKISNTNININNKSEISKISEEEITDKKFESDIVENKEHKSNSLILFFKELNGFIDKKISMLIDTKCEFTDNLTEKLQSNEKMISELLKDINEALKEIYNKSVLRVTEGFIKLNDIICENHGKSTNEEGKKQRGFIKSVIRQRINFYKTQLETLNFPHESIKKIIYQHLHTTEVNNELVKNNNKSDEFKYFDSKGILVLISFLIIIIFSLIPLVGPLLRKAITKNFKVE